MRLTANFPKAPSLHIATSKSKSAIMLPILPNSLFCFPVQVMLTETGFPREGIVATGLPADAHSFSLDAGDNGSLRRRTLLSEQTAAIKMRGVTQVGGSEHRERPVTATLRGISWRCTMCCWKAVEK